MIQADKRLTLVDSRRVDQPVNLAVLHYHINSFGHAVQHYYLIIAVNRDLSKVTGLNLAVGKSLALFGGVSNTEFHRLPP